ncbi:hypothetical protein K438DRAFT_1775655 [Mycena galopus ATCC 62051]|nr:hypothetical protein K438DRAFT_1775655 [Mycena galopus ATCC 62051]
MYAPGTVAGAESHVCGLKGVSREFPNFRSRKSMETKSTTPISKISKQGPASNPRPATARVRLRKDAWEGHVLAPRSRYRTGGVGGENAARAVPVSLAEARDVGVGKKQGRRREAGAKTPFVRLSVPASSTSPTAGSIGRAARGAAARTKSRVNPSIFLERAMKEADGDVALVKLAPPAPDSPPHTHPPREDASRNERITHGFSCRLASARRPPDIMSRAETSASAPTGDPFSPPISSPSSSRFVSSQTRIAGQIHPRSIACHATSFSAQYTLRARAALFSPRSAPSHLDLPLRAHRSDDDSVKNDSRSLRRSLQGQRYNRLLLLVSSRSRRRSGTTGGGGGIFKSRLQSVRCIHGVGPPRIIPQMRTQEWSRKVCAHGERTKKGAWAGHTLIQRRTGAGAHIGRKLRRAEKYRGAGMVIGWGEESLLGAALVSKPPPGSYIDIAHAHVAGCLSARRTSRTRTKINGAVMLRETAVCEVRRDTRTQGARERTCAQAAPNKLAVSLAAQLDAALWKFRLQMKRRAVRRVLYACPLQNHVEAVVVADQVLRSTFLLAIVNASLIYPDCARNSGPRDALRPGREMTFVGTNGWEKATA